MSGNAYFSQEVRLTVEDVLESLEEGIKQVPFEDEVGGAVYVSGAEVEWDTDSVIVEMTDGSKFRLTAEKVG